MEWKKNLFDYQAEPPAQAWDKINEQLELDAPVALREQLFAYEAAPPERLWDEVAARITETTAEPAPVKQLWYRKPWNIVAAAGIAAVIFGINYNRSNQSTTSGISTSVVSPIPADADPAAATPEQAPQQDPLRSAMENKDNNYIYFTTNAGETKRLSYKLQHLLPAIKENKNDKTLESWTNSLGTSAMAPASGDFLEIVEMVKQMEKQKN